MFYLYSQLFVKLQSYETFLLVFTKKFYKDFVQMKKVVIKSTLRKLDSQVKFSPSLQITSVEYLESRTEIFKTRHALKLWQKVFLHI